MTNFLRLKWQQFNDSPDALLAPLFSLLTLLAFIAIAAFVIFFLIGCAENEQQSAITDETVITFNGQLPHIETKDSLYFSFTDTIRNDTTLSGIGHKRLFIKPGFTVKIQ